MATPVPLEAPQFGQMPGSDDSKVLYRDTRTVKRTFTDAVMNGVVPRKKLGGRQRRRHGAMMAWGKIHEVSRSISRSVSLVGCHFHCSVPLLVNALKALPFYDISVVLHVTFIMQIGMPALRCESECMHGCCSDSF